jgi:two-component system CheB/CheR fusion protein
MKLTNGSNENDRGHASQSELFPIVGIGASAGGLEAFTQLLESLPINGGMGYVLIQHLDANHISRLSEILSKSTSIPIYEAVHDQKVEPDRIYTIPPNTGMTIVGGRLQLAPRAGFNTPFLPIDIFFNSLADDQQENAIGIILSGTGSDGTLGLERIKSSGGITLAQREDSCQFPAMPENAIRSGYVDFVLAPQEMGKELSRIGHHPQMLPRNSADTADISDEHYKTILDLLQNGVGVDFSPYRDKTIKRRILRRMVLHPRIEDLQGYVRHLENDPLEVRALYQDLLINVTSFFRDAEIFEALKTRIFPQLLSQRNTHTPLRIWVPGCSTGQEVYSLAMTLLEYLSEHGLQTPIQIFGTDLDEERSLKKARIGFYPQSIEAEVSEERLQRFFTKRDGGYQINKSLREVCVFAKHNIAMDPPFSKMDIISCRNLLIYLSTSLQRRIIPMFHYALNTGGVLVLGSSESVGQYTDLFEPMEPKLRIYSRKAVTMREYPHFKVRDLKAAPSSTFPTEVSTADWKQEADRLLLRKYAPAGVLVDEDFNILQFRGKTSPYLEPAVGEPSHHLSRMACEGLFPILRKAIHECREANKPVSYPATRIHVEGRMEEVDIQVIPIKLLTTPAKHYLVVFEKDKAAQRNLPGLENVPPQDQNEVTQLRQELLATNEYLQSVIEQKDAINEELRAANEETLSSNEELQSTNEELETAKEELQSVNEELSTVNEQLTYRNKELSQLNADLRESRDYTAAIVDTVREPLVVLNADLQVETANHAFYKMFHTTAEKTEGRYFYSLQENTWDIPDLRLLLEKILPQQKVLENYTVVHSSAPFGNKVLRLNARKLITRDDKSSPQILLAIEDITTSKRLEAESQAASKKLAVANVRKNEFIAMLAHELRNPLAPIRNALQIEELPNAPAKMKLDAHAIIKRQVSHLIRLVDDLLDISRISSGKIKLRKKPVKVSTIVKDTLELSDPLIAAHHHELKTDFPKKVLWLDVDRTRIIQILGNLLNNAAKYTPPHGKIWFGCTQADNQLIFNVKDNGLGIAKEKLPHIFDMFNQIDSSIERAQGGLGIGLSLAHNLARLHGATLTAKSEGLGKGAEFTLSISLAPAPGKVRPLHGANKKYASGKKHARVLVVDDNEPSAKTLGWMLELAGYEVRLSYNGPDAIHEATSFLPHLVLLDIGMPGMDGYKVCKELRKEASLSHTIIVAQTGWGQEERRKQSQEAGFDAHLLKPVSMKALKKLLLRLETRSQSGPSEGEDALMAI